MKKTIAINLNGILYTIDEDACELLEKYILNLKRYFEKETGADEIVGDMEARISELLSMQLSRNVSQIITIKQVEEIISQMGNPEEIDGQETPHDENATPKPEHEQVNKESGKRKKRLYRNPDDKMLSGVCGGLAVYFGLRTAGVRIILLLIMLFLPLPVLPIYLTLWLCLPLAETATERLEMYGEHVNLENIGKTLKEDFGSRENDRCARNKTDGCLMKGCLFSLLALLVTPILIGLIVAVIVSGTYTLAYFSDMPITLNVEPFYYRHVTPFFIFCKWSLIVAIWCMPIIALVYYAFRKRYNWPVISLTARWVWLIVWLLATMLYYSKMVSC